mmetsp:Transcript_86574/g.249975  ORF Transcript_86574/g.249975 Transcript_86574/m.249975 type:complete len:201 (-) Transcript_86574:175-777(-)
MPLAFGGGHLPRPAGAPPFFGGAPFFGVGALAGDAGGGGGGVGGAVAFGGGDGALGVTLADGECMGVVSEVGEDCMEGPFCMAPKRSAGVAAPDEHLVVGLSAGVGASLLRLPAGGGEPTRRKSTRDGPASHDRARCCRRTTPSFGPAFGSNADSARARKGGEAAAAEAPALDRQPCGGSRSLRSEARSLCPCCWYGVLG